MKIALIGFGTVGQALVELLLEKSETLQREHHLNVIVVAVATRSRGTLYHPDGLDTACLLEAAQSGSFDHYPESPGLIRDWDPARIASESSADVLVEASPTNLQTGQPALDLCYAALDSGKHLVLANKGPIAVAYAELAARARQHNRRVLFEGTVMAGTPSFKLAFTGLAGCEIRTAQGILNGTTNYILTEMESGTSYAEALKQAQALGYAETDPSGDVEGWDAAGKVVILAAALFGKKLTLESMSVQGISHLTLEDIQAAQAAGERWKLIATVTPEGGSVRPVRLPLTDPLANISGAMNAITYHTDLMGAVTLIGAGAGRTQTGFALLSDLLVLHKNGASHESSTDQKSK